MKQLHPPELTSLKQEFAEKGYVVLPRFFTKKEMNELRQWVEEVTSWPVVTEKWLKYFELLPNQEKVLSRVENFVNYHSKFQTLVRDSYLLDLLGFLMSQPVAFFKEKLNLKAPGARGYTPHQDAPAFFNIDYDAITLLIAIDEATLTSGCLYFAKEGTAFQKKMLPQNSHNRALAASVWQNIQWQPLVCKPGDVIIFSAYAPHYSPENKSQYSRRALFLTFGAAEKTMNKTAEYYQQKRKIFPQDSEKIPGMDYTAAAAIYSYSSPVIVNPLANSPGESDESAANDSSSD